MLETTSSSREAILESDGWNSHVTHQSPLEFPLTLMGGIPIIGVNSTLMWWLWNSHSTHQSPKPITRHVEYHIMMISACVALSDISSSSYRER